MPTIEQKEIHKQAEQLRSLTMALEHARGEAAYFRGRAERLEAELEFLQQK